MPLKIIAQCQLRDEKTEKFSHSTSCIFVDDEAFVSGEGRHNAQFMRYISHLSGERKEKLTTSEQESKLEQMVCLVHREKHIFIRPDITINGREIEKILKADEILQQMSIPKEYIRFLGASNEEIRKVLKERGELWRINSPPHTIEEMKKMVTDSKAALSDRVMYYYNIETGTRYLTCEEFSKLGSLPAEQLARYLNEIKNHSFKKNKRKNPELAFFMADEFNFNEYKDENFAEWDEQRLRFHFEALKSRFWGAVKAEFRKDNPENEEWRIAMLSRLIGKHDEEISEESLIGMCPEFYMNIRWLPGARIKRGEVIFDPVFDKIMPDEKKIYDEKVRSIILNFRREFDNIEYINVGRVIRSLSKREAMPGRREVYIVELKIKGEEKERVKVIRLQKFGAVERLQSSEETDVYKAFWNADEYKRYTLDRWSACEQLGMKLLPITTGEIYETFGGIEVPLIYFERNYIHGRVTDKIPASRFEDKEYAVRFAGLLGEAAAVSMIAGRVDNKRAVHFDDGDEVIVEDEKGMPVDLINTDITSSFGDYKTSLMHFAEAYAQPVTKRTDIVEDIKEFAQAYADAFVKKFEEIQQDYRSHKGAFNSLFKDRKHDPAGSFAYRWEKTLQRLDDADAYALGRLVMSHIKREIKK